MLKKTDKLPPNYVSHLPAHADIQQFPDATAQVLARGRGVAGNGRGLRLKLAGDRAVDGEVPDSGLIAPLAKRLEDFGIPLAPLVPVQRLSAPPEPTWEAGIDRLAYQELQRAHSKEMAASCFFARER